MALSKTALKRLTGVKLPGRNDSSANDITFLHPMGKRPKGVVGGDPTGLSNETFVGAGVAAGATLAAKTGRGLLGKKGVFGKIKVGGTVWQTLLYMGVSLGINALFKVISGSSGLEEKQLEMTKRTVENQLNTQKATTEGRNEAVNLIADYYKNDAQANEKREMRNYQINQQNDRDNLVLGSLLQTVSQDVLAPSQSASILGQSGLRSIEASAQPINGPDFIPQPTPTAVGANGFNNLLPVVLGGS